MKELQDLTKRSLRDKPFSNVLGKIWTETPSSTPIKEIFTKLRVFKKNYNREIELDDITQLWDRERLGTAEPCMVTIQGKWT